MTDPLDLVRDWDGLATVLHFDQPTGTWMVIALHDRRLGPPTGGTRWKPYPSLADAVRDAHRLAAGMTAKWAGIDRPYGGAKAVLMASAPLDAAARSDLLRRYGDLVDGLEDGFRTGPDMGTTAADMQIIAERTGSVMGLHPDTGDAIDPGPYTAQGVLAGIRAALAAATGSADLADRSVLIQGVGGVGAPLAQLLAAAGARLLLSDLDPQRSAALADTLAGTPVAAEKVIGTPCDVYAPCAVGATIHARSVPDLACRVVAGSANNQLATEADGDALAERGILYAPDWVINAGGALAFADLKAGEHDLERLRQRVDTAIETAVGAVLEEASAAGITPVEAAWRRVRRRLDPAG